MYARGSFRKKAVVNVEAGAPRDSDGNMICPTCGKVIPKNITVDTKKQVLDEYNSNLRVQCPPCNQGHLYEGVEGEFANGKK